MRKQQNCRLSEHQAQQRRLEQNSAGTILNFGEPISLDLLMEELAEIIETERGLLIP